MTATAGPMTAVTPAAEPPPRRPAQLGGPRWRALLEARWQTSLQQVTALSLAFHDAAAATPGGPTGQREPLAEQLMRQAVAARRALANTDEALGRLATGRFGRCECCAGTIPQQTLLRAPETRYCPRCADEPGRRSHRSAVDAAVP
jgi:RNA polymerase-binding transcription factor DksA